MKLSASKAILPMNGVDANLSAYQSAGGTHFRPARLRHGHRRLGEPGDHDNAVAAPLIANSTAIGTWEEFDLIHD